MASEFNTLLQDFFSIAIPLHKKTQCLGVTREILFIVTVTGDARGSPRPAQCSAPLRQLRGDSGSAGCSMR